MIIKSADELQEVTRRIMSAAGASDANALEVAEHLVRADLSGVSTHGTWHIKGYIERIQEGQLVPAATPKLLSETPVSVQVSGGWTFGQVAAKFTTEKAIEKAKKSGMAAAALVQTCHIGRLGHYAEMAAEQNMIGMIFLGGQGTKHPSAVPYGGREKTLLHTNPLSMGFPGQGDDPAMMFDFATTCVAGVKLHDAQRLGKKLAPDTIVDKDGRASTDPNDFFDGGAHLAFGKHKGYAIMMAMDYFGRVLVGADAFVDEEHGHLYDRYSGTFIMVMKADLFQAIDAFTETAESYGEAIRACPPADGFDKVLMPGDMEREARKVRSRDGIPIDPDVWQTIVEAGEMVGIKDL